MSGGGGGCDGGDARLFLNPSAHSSKCINSFPASRFAYSTLDGLSARKMSLDEKYCDRCDRTFKTKYNYERHIQSKACRNIGDLGERLQDGRLRCRTCGSCFARIDSLKRHCDIVHPHDAAYNTFVCGICRKGFRSQKAMATHRIAEHVVHTDFRVQKSAHKRQCQILRAFFPTNLRSLDEILFYCADQIKKLASTLAVEFEYFKIGFNLRLDMYRESNDLEQVEAFDFRSFAFPVSRMDMDEARDNIFRAVGDFERHVTEFLHMGSGWSVSGPVFLDAEVVKCNPLAGGGSGDNNSCGLHVANYERRRGIQAGVVNRQHQNGDCFYYAIAAYFLGKNAEQEKLEKYVTDCMAKLDTKGPVNYRKIPEFERLNPAMDLAVNVIYKDETGKVIPAYASKNIHAKNKIALLLFHTTDKDEDGASVQYLHYALVDDPERLLAKRRVYNDEGKMRTSAVYICWNCCNTMKTKGAYDSHVR